ncbi:unnamed protein product, partial [Effrenium voratum]
AARGGRVPAGGLGPEPRRLPGAPGRRRRGGARPPCEAASIYGAASHGLDSWRSTSILLLRGAEVHRREGLQEGGWAGGRSGVAGVPRAADLPSTRADLPG